MEVNIKSGGVFRGDALKKRAIKLSQKQFFHTLRKHRKTFAAAKVQQKNDMCKELPRLFQDPTAEELRRTARRDYQRTGHYLPCASHQCR